MAENNESPEEAPELTGDVHEAPAAPAKPRLRDRVWSFRAMLAVGLATLLIGGAGGAAIVAVTDGGHDRHPRFGRFAEGPGRGPGGYGGYGGYGGGQQFRNGPGQNGFGQNGPRFRNGPQQADPNGPQSTQPTPTPGAGASS